MAGGAYRLGLRRYDERLHVWHDYPRRAAGEEVVMAMTVAARMVYGSGATLERRQGLREAPRQSARSGFQDFRSSVL